MTRISRDEMFMNIAHNIALRSTCERGQHGAVIVQDKRIVSTGYNGSPSGLPHCLDVGCEIGPEGGCIRTVHAEANAIAFAAKHGIALQGSTLYCTSSPCLNCARLMINAGIKAIVVDALYRDLSGLLEMSKTGIALYRYKIDYLSKQPDLLPFTTTDIECKMERNNIL